jgi:hypothetical protein
MKSRQTQAGKKLTSYEKTSSILLALSLALNLYLGIAQNTRQREADVLQARQVAAQMAFQREELSPRLTLSRLILPGNSIKALPKVDWSAALIEGVPHPEFVQTQVGNQLYRLVDSTTAIRALRGISAEFLVLRNDGKRTAAGVTLRSSKDSSSLVLGTIEPATTKLIPTYFRRTQPWLERSESRQYDSFSYEFRIGDSIIAQTATITPKAATSWIPTLETFFGVGRALITRENEHLFRQLQ